MEEEKEQLYVWAVQLRSYNCKVVAYNAEDAINKARSLTSGSHDLIGLQCGEKVDAVATNCGLTQRAPDMGKAARKKRSGK